MQLTLVGLPLRFAFAVDPHFVGPLAGRSRNDLNFGRMVLVSRRMKRRDGIA